MQRLNSASGDFAARFRALVEAGRGEGGDVSAAVRTIIEDVRQRGDAAIAELTARFDGFDPAGELRIPTGRIDAALKRVDKDLLAAMELAASRIRAFHEVQRPADHQQVDETGTRTGWRYSPIAAAGLYVPGGRAALFSSVLMNAIPAKVAGVEQLVMVTPTPGGEPNDEVLAAAKLAGVDTIYRIGGAQAVAALAFGTESVPAVDFIAGPGNAFVAEAKRQLYGRIGIDMVAGPSEILIVADSGADPAVLAADLLSQAEHDPTSQSILITDSPSLAQAVLAALPAAFDAISTAETARASWDANGAVIEIADLSEAPALIDALAPEHLLLAVRDPDAVFARVRHAGSVFLGYDTPEAIGDYLAGPNHVLPTGRRARFSSGLGTANFMKRTTFLGCGPEGFQALGPPAARLAEAEGLPAHALSITRRLDRGA
ncbi:histidinol dehydrogenase [Pacificimonas flava]|uniref:Histidinol dehydrogenase n=1 Tax=Pacificimonas flava TaxID=1234595 RepID=M2S949_9SPHN|nr:histidinol dehydrogenase [Pacificimonas flava]EMD81885.1 Histidinol dehydrogenase [Pacificimonas flava]MBB5281587.1 histidinol dehydrogenase [Pacificimonas flava]